MKLISELKTNDLVEHPSGVYSFGVVPAVVHLGLKEGHIYLRRGQHSPAKDKGYGVEHIWAAHEYDLKEKGYRIIEDVAYYVADIIQPGTDIFFNEKRFSKNKDLRVTVLRSSYGLVIAEARNDRSGFGYYIVTAFSKRTAEGTLIGVTK